MTPTPTITKPQEKSPALIAVESLEARVNSLANQQGEIMAKTYTEIKELQGEIGIVRGILEGIAELLQKPQPAPAPATNGTQPHGNSVTFRADTIVMTYNDQGEARYKAKGGRYTKFGVNVWPEVLPLLGLDASKLKPGPNPVSLNVIAELVEKEDESGEMKTIANKVFGLA